MYNVIKCITNYDEFLRLAQPYHKGSPRWKVLFDKNKNLILMTNEPEDSDWSWCSYGEYGINCHEQPACKKKHNNRCSESYKKLRENKLKRILK